MKKDRIVLRIIAGTAAVMLLLILILFIRQAAIGRKINDDYTVILNQQEYQEPVFVHGIDFITQEISCGYAVIEMLAQWRGKNITEQYLFEENNDTISTAMGNGFLDEMKKQFPEWDIKKQKNLTNSAMLSKMHKSLSNGMPVPVEFAALRETETKKIWTLHFVVVTGMDLTKDKITVQNPYGYEETYSVQDFLRAVRYESYENMELFIKFGFAFGMFHKNTMYLISES